MILFKKTRGSGYWDGKNGGLGACGIRRRSALTIISLRPAEARLNSRISSLIFSTDFPTSILQFCLVEKKSTSQRIIKRTKRTLCDLQFFLSLPTFFRPPWFFPLWASGPVLLHGEPVYLIILHNFNFETSSRTPPDLRLPISSRPSPLFYSVLSHLRQLRFELAELHGGLRPDPRAGV